MVCPIASPIHLHLQVVYIPQVKSSAMQEGVANGLSNRTSTVVAIYFLAWDNFHVAAADGSSSIKNPKFAAIFFITFNKS